MNIGDIFIAAFIQPVINLLIILFQFLESLHIPGALGFALVILTVAIRLLVWPLMTSQIKMTKKMADLKPHLDELKKKHKDDKKAMASAQMALYKDHGVNPAGGCLPALLQIPIFIGLYQAIINILPSQNGNLQWLNSLVYFPGAKLQDFPDPNFFGLNLGTKPSEFGKFGLALLLIPVVTAALTFLQSKMTMPSPIKHHKDEPKSETKEKEGMEESMGQVQSQMVYLMPVMIGYFAFQFPVGLAIYWNTYTILGIIQQYRIAGWGGMSGLIAKFKVKSLDFARDKSVK